MLLGDRFEIFVAAQAAMNQRIPIAHIHGGELTEGAVDDAIRHAISKLAHLHFTATEAYRQRVMQLGEQPDRVFNVGTPGLDNIYKLPLLNKLQLEQALNFSLGARNILITFHPVTLENATVSDQFAQLLLALDSFTDIHIIFTHGNADADGRVISAMIENYRRQHPARVASYVSLGSLRYLSTLRLMDAIIGNSSSGLLEAPALMIPTVNIGDRQRGRICANSVINCLPQADEISKAMQTVFSADFAATVKNVVNPYGAGGASEKIKHILKRTALAGLLKKRFYDLPRI